MKLIYKQLTGPRAQREQNIQRALLAIHHFGHMRHAEIARLNWPASTIQSRAAAVSRFLKEMVEGGYLHRRLNSIGSYSYVLAKRGAALVGQMVKETVYEGSRITGIQGRSMYHRTLGTAWMVEQIVAGHEVLSEFSVNSHRGVITRAALNKQWGKLPDGLVLHEVRDDTGQVAHYNVDWLEVESTYKSPEQRERLMNFAWNLGQPLLPGMPYYLDRVIFLYTSDSKHESALVRSATEKLRQTRHQIDDPEALLGSIVLTSVEAAIPLRIGAFREVDLYTLMKQDSMLMGLLEPLELAD